MAAQTNPLTPFASYPDMADLSGWTLDGTATTFAQPVTSPDGPALRLTDSSFNANGSTFLDTPLSLPAGGNVDFALEMSFRQWSFSPGGIGDQGQAPLQLFLSSAPTMSADGFFRLLLTPGVDALDMDHNDGDPWAPIVIPGNYGNAAVWTLWADYDGSEHQMDVYLSDTGTKPATPTGTFPMGLEFVGDQVYFGLAHVHGTVSGTNDILSFDLQVGEPNDTPAYVTTTLQPPRQQTHPDDPKLCGLQR